MERTRNISISLIFLSLALGATTRNIVSISGKDYALLGFIIVVPHLVGLISSRTKILQNISPLISAFIGLEMLLYRFGGAKFEKLLPTISNLKNLSKQGQLGISGFEEQSIPIKATAATVIVIAFLLWAISELIETLAKRLHLYGTAFALYIIFFAISTNISNVKFEPALISIFCLACWIYLRATYKNKISSSAHQIEIDSAVRYKLIFKNLLMTALVIGLCIAVVLPISSLPSLAPKNLFNSLYRDSAKTELSPLVSMRAQLKDEKNILMFTAQTDTAQYFRVGVLNRFDGDTWSYTSPSEKYTEPVISDRGSSKAHAKFQLKGLSPKFLPTIYDTDSTSSRNIEILKDSTIYSKNADILNYEIDASVPVQEFNELQIENGSKPTPKELEEYLLIPKDFDPEIEKLSREIASNKGSIYEQIIALQNYFVTGDFKYSIDVDYTSSQKSMSAFLEQKVGFCEQFAATFAAMARSIRIPSRVVIGFTPGAADVNGNFNVMSKQAHSWVEVYLTDIGWITIDPTPKGDLPGQAPSNIGEVVATTSTTTTTIVTTSASTSASTQNSVSTSNTIKKSEVKPIESTSKYFFTPIKLLLVAFVIAISIGGYFIRKTFRKKAAKVTPISLVHSSYKKILKLILPERDARYITVREAKTSIPKTYINTIKFLEQYSDYSYSPDSDINIEELTNSAQHAIDEIEIFNKTSV